MEKKNSSTKLVLELNSKLLLTLSGKLPSQHWEQTNSCLPNCTTDTCNTCVSQALDTSCETSNC